MKEINRAQQNKPRTTVLSKLKPLAQDAVHTVAHGLSKQGIKEAGLEIISWFDPRTINFDPHDYAPLGPDFDALPPAPADEVKKTAPLMMAGADSGSSTPLSNGERKIDTLLESLEKSQTSGDNTSLIRTAMPIGIGFVATLASYLLFFPPTLSLAAVGGLALVIFAAGNGLGYLGNRLFPSKTDKLVATLEQTNALTATIVFIIKFEDDRQKAPRITLLRSLSPLIDAAVTSNHAALKAFKELASQPGTLPPGALSAEDAQALRDEITELEKRLTPDEEQDLRDEITELEKRPTLAAAQALRDEITELKKRPTAEQLQAAEARARAAEAVAGNPPVNHLQRVKGEFRRLNDIYNDISLTDDQIKIALKPALESGSDFRTSLAIVLKDIDPANTDLHAVPENAMAGQADALTQYYELREAIKAKCGELGNPPHNNQAARELAIFITGLS